MSVVTFTDLVVVWIVVFIVIRVFFIDVFGRPTGAILGSSQGSVVVVPEPKRFSGWYCSKADDGRPRRESYRYRGDVVDRRYVHNAGREPDWAGQKNYDPHSPILEPPLPPLPPLGPWAGRERRPPVRDQDRLRTWIHWWKPYVWFIM